LPARIYVVEDEGITAIGLRRLLKNWGYEVPNFAFSGIEACKKIDEINPDLVLMDIKVKGEFDGIDAAEHIKKHFDVPIIFLTAYNSKDLIERAKKVGYEYYVVKPYDEEDLHQKIENVFSKYGIKSSGDEIKKEETSLNENLEEFPGENKNVFENLFKNDLITNPLLIAEKSVKNDSDELDSELIETGKNLSENFKNGKNAIIIVDNNGYLRYMDINSLSFIGCEEEFAISKNFDELVKLSNGCNVTDILVREPLNKGTVVKNQINLVTNDENKINVNYRSLPIRIDNGNFAGVCIVFENVKSSEKPKEKEEMDNSIKDLNEDDNCEIDFKEVYLKIPIPVGIFNSDGLILYFNKAALDMFELLNIMELEDLNIFEEFEFKEEDINNFFEGTDIISSFNFKLKGSDCDIGCELSLNHLDSWGNNPLIMAVFQKKSVKEHKVKQDNKEYRKNLDDNDTNALCVFSPEGTIKYANKTFYSQLTSGNNYFSIFPNALRIRIKMSISSLTQENNKITVKNLTKMSDNGLKLWNWVYKGVFDNNEELIEINSSGHQITENFSENIDLESHNKLIEEEVSENRIMKRIS